MSSAALSQGCIACMSTELQKMGKGDGPLTFEMPWMFLNLKAPMPQTSTGTLLAGKGCP